MSVPDDIRAAVAALGVEAFVHARDLSSAAEVAVDADSPVVLASAFKVLVAVELARQFDAGILTATERVVVAPEGRTSGGTGISVLQDELEISLRDLAQLMISVSDNAATDIVTARVGIDQVNATMRRLGLHDTIVEGDCNFLLTRLVADLRLGPEEEARLEAGDEEVLSEIAADRWAGVRDVQPAATNRSTPREMTRLLELVWKNEAASPEGCAFVRAIMGQQVWPHRLRSGFAGAIKTSGKTGTLPTVRNEVGVVEYPDGGVYAVAVFTVAESARLHRPDVDRVIGEVAALAVEGLRR